MDAVRVLVAERDDVLAGILDRCLDDPRFLLTSGRDPESPLTATESDPPQVVVLGPGWVTSEPVVMTSRLFSKGCRVLVVAHRSEHDAAMALLLAGASGLVYLDDASPNDVADAVLAVASGTSALHPSVVDAVLSRWRSVGEPGAQVPDAGAVPAAALTARERDVLLGLRDGLSNRLLANRLGVADKTVEAHKSRLYAKLGARNQAHAVRIALEHRLI